MDIALLQGQAASSLTVYHCTPHSMCLSVISYLKNLEVPHVLLGPYFTRVLLVSFLPIVAYFAISYMCMYRQVRTIDAYHHSIVRIRVFLLGIDLPWILEATLSREELNLLPWHSMLSHTLLFELLSLTGASWLLSKQKRLAAHFSPNVPRRVQRRD